MRAALLIAAAIASLAVLTGCESTVDLAKTIAKRGVAAFNQKNLTVARADRQVRVLASTIVQDSNGTAVVVTLRSGARAPMVNAPIAINLKSAAGASVFRNNLAGSEPALTHVALLLPGQPFDWINDQVQPSGTPARVSVRVGAGMTPTGPLPRITLSGVNLSIDPVSGATISGQVHNASTVPQTNLVVYAVARRGGRIVSAGRAVLAHLAANATLPFHAYVIGNPRGAQLSVTAPPTVLR